QPCAEIGERGETPPVVAVVPAHLVCLTLTALPTVLLRVPMAPIVPMVLGRPIVPMRIALIGSSAARLVPFVPAAPPAPLPQDGPGQLLADLGHLGEPDADRPAPSAGSALTASGMAGRRAVRRPDALDGEARQAAVDVHPQHRDAQPLRLLQHHMGREITGGL